MHGRENACGHTVERLGLTVTELLAAIDRLTKPETSKVIQERNGITCTSSVERPPLLTQMAESVNPSSNKDTGSASSPSTRSPADLDALFEYAKMTAAIGDWCRIEKIGATRDAVVDLRRWYASRLALVNPDDSSYIRTLRKWEHTIRNHLDPPKTFTIPVGCPVCGKREFGDSDNGGTFPIMVEYRRSDDEQTVGQEQATCRACKTVWFGRAAIEELGEELRESGKLA